MADAGFDDLDAPIRRLNGAAHADAVQPAAGGGRRPERGGDRPGHPRPDPGVSPTPWPSRSPSPGSAGTWRRASSSAGSSSDGETVRAGDPLFTLEGEKATQDVEAIDAGHPADRPRRPRRPATVVAVGAVIGYLLAPGEADPPVARRAAESGVGAIGRRRGDGGRTRRRLRRPRPAAPIAATVAIGRGARRWPGGSRASWASTGRGSRGSGCTGRIRKVDVLAAAAAIRRPRLAARLADAGAGPSRSGRPAGRSPRGWSRAGRRRRRSR